MGASICHVGAMSKERGEATRRALCLAAETLVAQHGLEPVTLRRIAEASGQRNVSAVTYHFGTVRDLLRAIVLMRLQETEAARRAWVADCPDPAAMDAFTAWLGVVRPVLLVPDEQVPHAHARLLLHMRMAGLLSDPFDPAIDRGAIPMLDYLLGRIRAGMAHLPPEIARARVGLCGLMYWNAIALHAESDLPRILADVEASARLFLLSPAPAPGSGPWPDTGTRPVRTMPTQP